MLAAVQAYNNPLITFKTETFVVLSVIAWTYLLHAHYRSKKIDYRYREQRGKRKRFTRNPDGTIRYWELRKCLSVEECPLDQHTKNNLQFMMALRNQVEHRKAAGLDTFLSARYQACALNFNAYLKKLHGDRYRLDRYLALSLQFAELDYNQAQTIRDKENLIPADVVSFIAKFDSQLSAEEVSDERYAYRLLFVKVTANRKGQADRVIEFIDPKSDLAATVAKEYWVKQKVEAPKLNRKKVLEQVRAGGFNDFGPHQHTLFVREHEAKNPAKGFGVEILGNWYWYENWPVYIIAELQKKAEAAIAVEAQVKQVQVAVG